MLFSAHIFKAYDIRGLVDGELSEELAYAIGQAFVRVVRERETHLAGRKIVVGRDMRPTSPQFESAVIDGIEAEGMSVVAIGEVSTPLFNFAVAHYQEHAAGIMITASHNPAAYNGFKMTFENGLPLGKNTGMDRVRSIAATLFEQKLPRVRRSIVPESLDILPVYRAKIFSLVPPKSLKPLKIVIDAGNGMAAATFPEILKHIPVTVEYLYLTPDGTFPNHEANPLKTETLSALQKRVRETGADLGFALDGDCDRIGLVDEKGNVVDASFVGALVGLEVLRSAGGKGHMFYDLRSSMIVRETWEAHGATTSMCPVGHALIKKILKDENGLFASELSLHQYFHSMYDVESSDLSLLYILQALSREQKPLSELIKPLQKYFHSGEINFEIHDKERVLKSIEMAYASQALDISHLDGLYIKCAWGWFNVRASNTEPLLRLTMEATSKELLEKYRTDLYAHITRF